jgi:large subunit ribosomal protein L5
MARLRDQFLNEIRPKLAEELGITNMNALPRIKKITISCGVGDAKDNKKLLTNAISILEKISGQKAVATRAKLSIAQFRLRQGMAVGARVTLRGTRMYEFLDRLVNVVIPRIRDFRGLKRRFDQHGNYNMGLTEQSVFPEIGTELLESSQGMNIAITIVNGSEQGSTVLLRSFNFPFKRDEEAAVA